MKFLKHILYAILLCLTAGLAHSCYIDRAANEVCGYTARLRYDYNYENESSVNVLPDYIFSMDEYLFDGQGVLISANRLSKDKCLGIYVSETTLLPGRYSVVTIGNRSEMSVINEAIPGKTRREDMLMTLDASLTRADLDGAGNTDKLYYGYRTFTVEQNSVTNVRVDMVHHHFSLRYRVKWEADTPNGGDYVVRLEGVPSRYAVMPRYVYPEAGKCEDYDCDAHDLFAVNPVWVKHHISTVSLTDNVTDHALPGYINVGRELNGHFITYRHRNDTHATFCLYRRDGNALDPVMKPINLSDYLARLGIDLDRTLKQEYAIEFTIKANGQVLVVFMDIDDWDDGGVIS